MAQCRCAKPPRIYNDHYLSIRTILKLKLIATFTKWQLTLYFKGGWRLGKDAGYIAFINVAPKFCEMFT